MQTANRNSKIEGARRWRVGGEKLEREERKEIFFLGRYRKKPTKKVGTTITKYLRFKVWIFHPSTRFTDWVNRLLSPFISRFFQVRGSVLWAEVLFSGAEVEE